MDTNIKGLVFGREPVIIMSLIQALVSTVVVFGLDLSTAQSAAIIGLAGAILAVIARQNVTPVNKVPEVVVGVEQADGEVTPAVLVAKEEQAGQAQVAPKRVVVDRPSRNR